MMSLFEKATIIYYHRCRIKVFAGGTVRALGWLNSDSQSKRFAALAQVGDLNGCSLFDIGCGHGDLKGYLDERFHGFSYIGIDQMPEFIAEARCLYGQRPNCYFCLADFTTQELPRTDYVFASGVLSYRSAEKDCYFSMIGKMFDAANKALAFNMLDAEKFPHHELLIGHDSGKILAFCKTLSSDVKLIKGYLEDDFTVWMYKDGFRPGQQASESSKQSSEPELVVSI